MNTTEMIRTEAQITTMANGTTIERIETTGRIGSGQVRHVIRVETLDHHDGKRPATYSKTFCGQTATYASRGSMHAVPRTSLGEVTCSKCIKKLEAREAAEA